MEVVSFGETHIETDKLISSYKKLSSFILIKLIQFILYKFIQYQFLQKKNTVLCNQTKRFLQKSIVYYLCQSKRFLCLGEHKKTKKHRVSLLVVICNIITDVLRCRSSSCSLSLWLYRLLIKNSNHLFSYFMWLQTMIDIFF